MAKNSQEQIDRDEHKILQELKSNANMSINEIAKKCGFSRQKVWRVIKNLEKDHTIWGYTAIIDEEKKGLTNYIVLIKKSTHPIDKKLADLIISRKLEELIPNSEIIIEHSYYTHGNYDWIICFQTNNLKNAKLFCESLNKTYHEYIRDLDLIQIIFPVVIQGILNPEAKKLKQFL